MKTKRLFLPILILLFFVFQSNAQIINFEEAQQIAKQCLGEILSKNSQNIKLEEEYFSKENNSEPVYYIFNEKSGGYVIISAEFKTVPVLGYSSNAYISNNTDEWSPEFTYWLGNYEEQIIDLRQKNLNPTPVAIFQRNKLENGESLGLMPTKDVAPLLATTWNQGCGYNALCPADGAGPCGRVYTGCVATAMAQVIRYNEHPVNGIGDKCYTHYVYGEQCADFAAATYDYSTMPNASGNPEVAELMFHCGVSVNMDYSPSGSGAYSSSVVTAYRNYFDYKNAVILAKTSYTDDVWNRILREEIDNNRPFYYAGQGSSGGHAFVFDGYQGLDYFHINWGWGGSQNGYFYCSDLSPGSYDFTSSQRAIIGAIPSSLFVNMNTFSSTELTCATPVSQDLATGNDYYNYYKNTYPVTPGKELIYHFTTTLPGRIRVKITNSSDGSLYAMLFNYQHQDSLINYGTNNLVLDDMPPGTYYLVIESS
ncbi:MAG: C10 family peptidase, partial [Bacteroidales bacterium]|nr:C10 family peptidase [Bacteroidales bacterium]